MPTNYRTQSRYTVGKAKLKRSAKSGANLNEQNQKTSSRSNNKHEFAFKPLSIDEYIKKSSENVDTSKTDSSPQKTLKATPTMWKCQICAYRNEEAAEQCVACDNFRPGKVREVVKPAVNATSLPQASNNVAKPASNPSFAFSNPAKAEIGTNTANESPKFSFTTQAPEKTNSPSQKLQANVEETQTAPTPSFSFAKTVEKSGPEETVLDRSKNTDSLRNSLQKYQLQTPNRMTERFSTAFQAWRRLLSRTMVHP